MQKTFSTHQVARMCHVSRGSIIRWIHEGKLKAAVTAGGHHRILDSEVVSFLRGLNLPIPPQLAGLEESRPPVVLIIDDDEQLCETLHHFFRKKFPHFQIEEVQEGFEAGMMAQRLKPDLILLDIILPGMNGYQVCETIRQQQELAHTKIIAMTGIETEQAEKKILEMGADDFLSKPFYLETLEKKINHYLSPMTPQTKVKGRF